MWALFLLAPILATAQDEALWKCPQHWLQFQSSCYRFIKSPLHTRNDARRNCQAYESDLVSVNTVEEHGFLLYNLLWQDPQHRRWYISAHQQSPNYWVNEDGTPFPDMESAFLPDSQDMRPSSDYLVYRFSDPLKKWGLQKVTGEELLLYICEAPLTKLHYIVTDDRTPQYGIDVEDPLKIPMGPYFIKQPIDVVFDLSKRKITNDVSLSCFAGGYPAPVYEWFKEDYQGDKLIPVKIDPLNDPRFTISGGTLIIHQPKKVFYNVDNTIDNRS